MSFFPRRSMSCRLMLVAISIGLSSLDFMAADNPSLEDPALRKSLPEHQVIPAATPAELTPALPIRPEPFSRWTRSQGDAGARRYSTLKQINRENVRKLEVAWTYESHDGTENINVRRSSLTTFSSPRRPAGPSSPSTRPPARNSGVFNLSPSGRSRWKTPRRAAG